jgi:RNA polymerase sigma-70 factor (ECF subfamily)
MSINQCRDRDELYRQAAESFGGAIARMARGYEADPDLARDLEQDIHVALWRSLCGFRGESELSTWVWRVAHNTGVKHIQARTRHKRSAPLVPIENMDISSPASSPERQTDEAVTLERVYRLIHALRPADRQVMLLYLEELDASRIGEITGLSPGAVATRISRIKAALAAQLAQGVTR